MSGNLRLEDAIDLVDLDRWGGERERYLSADPFPHIVFDNVLRAGVGERLAGAFPLPTDPQWIRFKARHEHDKLQSTSEMAMPGDVRDVLAALNSATFVEFLERLTGIEGIVPDPHLYGGGMHQTVRGGHLGVHIDYNLHERWRLDRRLNVLLYLNSEWDEDWGGALEFWDSDVKACRKRVFPVLGRMVIFSTTERSWHGHPEPLACPDGMTRKSLALYYYTNGRPESERAASHNTVFVGTPNERARWTARDLILEFTPPIVLRAWRAIRRR